MKKLLLSIFIIALIISCGHRLNTEVEQAVIQITKDRIVYPGWEKSTEAFENLDKVASVEDLLSLTENENLYVRYYAFIGLREKKYPKLLDIYNKHKNDVETISTSNGACLKGDEKISFLMLRSLNPENPDFKWLTKSEYDKLYEEQIRLY